MPTAPTSPAPLPAFGAAEVVTLLLTDLVDSTKLTAALGDARFAELMARHDRAARDVLARLNGHEIERTDGFLLLFERPIDAVRFAFAYHELVGTLLPAGISSTSADEGITGPPASSSPTQRPMRARVGIHLGEAVRRENAPEDVARGAKPLQLEGLAVPAVARIMSLAQGGQTLMTRAAFDVARRAAVGDEALAADVRWLAHGPYLFKGFDEPVEVFEVGVPGASPLAPPPNSEKVHRAIRPGEEELLGWRPSAGAEVKRRPGWMLERKLGEGGFGEVWLAQHARTRERRVFKFCFAYERLRALKRELTLFLLIKEALGERDDIQRLYDLNFDEPPYFLEMDYSEGGDLAQWAEARGGLATVPLAARLELVAQVADAAGAAHSLGIIHKDIKPPNILVQERSGGAGILPAGGRGSARDATSGRQDARPIIQAKLTDFGIGQLADKSILEQVKVAATGFTGETLANTELSSRTGTRLYMAPELLAGRVPSVQSDVYALGVVLYQAIVGDLARPVTTDWRERTRQAGADALLVEDLDACLAGEPSARLASARELATRLRTLPERRRARRRRNFIRVAAAASVLMLVLLAAAGWWIGRERERADVERSLRESAQANERRALAAEREADEQRRAAVDEKRVAEEQRDIAFRQYQGAGNLVAYMLGELRDTLDLQLPHDQEVAAAVGRGTADYYRAIDTTGFSRDLLLEHAHQLHEAGLRFTDLALYDEAMALTTPSLALHEQVLGPDDAETGTVAGGLGILLMRTGQLEEARRLILRNVAIAERDKGRDHPDTATSLNSLATVETLLGRFEEAMALHERVIALREEALGPSHPEVAQSLNNAAEALRQMGRLAEAKEYAGRALSLCEQNEGPDSPSAAVALSILGSVLQDLGEPDEALPLFQRFLAVSEKAFGPEHPTVADALNNIGLLLRETGRLEEALPYYERSLALRERVQGSEHPQTALQLNNLGALLRAMKRPDDARRALERSLAIRERVLGPDHPETASSLNSLGLLLKSMGHLDEALPYYERALATRETALGPGHPMTALSLGNLGSLYFSMKRYDDALPLFERQLAIREEALGPTHPATLESLSNVSYNLRSLKRHDEARPFVEQLLRRLETKLGAGHPETVDARRNLFFALIAQAWAAQQRGDEAAARARFEEAVAVADAHPELLESSPAGRVRLAGALQQLGREEDAREHVARLQREGYPESAGAAVWDEDLAIFADLRHAHGLMGDGAPTARAQPGAPAPAPLP